MGLHRRTSRKASETPRAAWYVLGMASGALLVLTLERVANLLRPDDLALVGIVRDLAVDEFVREVDPEELVDDALRGMVSGLDAYSRFYASEDLARLDRETSGEFRGIGVVFRAPGDPQILFAYPASPAAEAGLRSGDRILEVQGRPVEGSVSEVLQPALEGQGNLTLRVQGLDGTVREAELRPRKVLDPTVRHVRILDRDAGIGYLALTSFSHHTLEEFDSAIEGLRERGARSFVLDLRGNPGGILDAAVAVANRFIPEGTIVSTRERHETHVTVAEPAEATLSGTPLVLLVDGDSASASEVLAGALQDHGAAVLIGESTYGKGTVQTLERFSNGRGVVKLTTAVYLTPSGRSLERDPETADGGIAPDLEVEVSSETRQAVHEYLQRYSPPPEVLPEIRAWEAAEGVRLLPSPPEDPQLDAALRLLRGERLELTAEALPR